MSDKNISSEATTTKKGGKIIPIVSICGAVAAGAVIGVMAFSNSSENTEEKELRNVVVNKENIEEVLEKMDDSGTIAFGTYEVCMNYDWIFADGSAVSENAYVENSEVNTNDIYFDIIRNDTNETIYESPVLPESACSITGRSSVAPTENPI